MAYPERNEIALSSFHWFREVEQALHESVKKSRQLHSAYRDFPLIDVTRFGSQSLNEKTFLRVHWISKEGGSLVRIRIQLPIESMMHAADEQDHLGRRITPHLRRSHFTSEVIQDLEKVLLVVVAHLVLKCMASIRSSVVPDLYILAPRKSRKFLPRILLKCT